MKKIIKQVLKKIVSKKFVEKFKYAMSKAHSDKGNTLTKQEKLKCLICDVNKVKIFEANKLSNIKKYIKSNIKTSDYFTYFINFWNIEKNYSNFNHNMTPDYSVILENSIEDFKKIYSKNVKEIEFLEELERYLNYYIFKIRKLNYNNKENTIKYLENIKDKKCESFIEALQRILFFNQIFWQMGYKLCGLGRLDYILDQYYKNDLEKGILKQEQLKEIFIDFFKTLNLYFKDKSGCLNGDTGQIIIIGGVDEKGKNFSNDLTYAFIDALKEYNRPDPKLFLRVNKDIEKKLLAKAIDCMATGIGSPLLSNDDVIIPKLIEFGYDKEDAWNYATAACWEPSPCGDSIDFNNIQTINLLQSFNEIFEDTEKSWALEEIKKKYFKNLSVYIEKELTNLSKIQFAEQPYLSLFIKGCRETSTLINEGNAKYKNLGVTTLGISNVVNSLLNIEEIVFNRQVLTLNEFNKVRKLNFTDEKTLSMIKDNNKYGYGSTNKKAIDLTNEIIKFISNEFEKYTTFYGGKFKFGLSAPSYVEIGKEIEASFDGRKNGEPLNVHISSFENTYIDIMDFASSIKYEKNTINGNVIDYFLTPDYMKNNLSKFTDYILAYIKKGIYQLQINVVDSKILIDAKENPDLYKNLIVRVWGFSAYFNELPEEYKNLLIKRAQEAERLYS